MADNPVEHSRTKHIDIRYHQQKGDIEITYVSTHNQLADIFTKPLDEKTFSKLRNELNILDSRNFDWNIAHIANLYTLIISFSFGTNAYFLFFLCQG
jgi:FPC/CPF motif-containing protein YcgG